jgi:hypothetical protein
LKEKGEVGDCFKEKGEADDGANVMLSKMLNASENYPYGLLNGIENPLYCYFLFWLVKLSVARDPVFAKYLPVASKCADIIVRVWFLMVLKTNIINHWNSYRIILPAIQSYIKKKLSNQNACNTKLQSY